MRRLFSLVTLLLVSTLCAHCGGGGTDGSDGGPAATASVRVTPAGVTLGVGQTATLTAEALDATGGVLAGKTFAFSTSNAAIALVSGNRNEVTITAVAAGSATISATSEGKTGSASLTVSAVADIQVTGRVIDGETRAGIANAGVNYVGIGGSGSTVTGPDGSFSFAVQPSEGSSAVDVAARAAGYVSTDLFGARVGPGPTQIETLVLVRQTSTRGAIFGAVRDARNNNGIGSAGVDLFRGQGEVPTQRVGTRLTDAAGGFSFTDLDAGTYTLYASGAGFREGRRTAITVATGAVLAQDVVLSPESAEVRVVLTWGSTPRDLDSHLTGPNPSDAGRFHAYFGNRLNAVVAPFAGLDLDDVDGGGPETVTITRLNSGNYRYSVHDFTNRSSSTSTELGRSGARVELYTAQGKREFFVPHQPGTLWTVFDLSGDIANPTITPRNEMGFASDAGAIP